MRRVLALAVALAAAAGASAGPLVAGKPHAASINGFTGAYLDTVLLSLETDPRYGSRLLDALDTHLQAVGVMTSPQEVVDYLEQSAGGSEGVKSLRGALGREPLDTTKASALLLADALARPEQFREMLDGLESLKQGLGRHAADLVRRTLGARGKKVFAALREADKPGRKKLASRVDAGWFSLFDAKSTGGRDGGVLESPVPDDGAKPRSLERTLPPSP
jgi:hypothetical protein